MLGEGIRKNQEIVPLVEAQALSEDAVINQVMCWFVKESPKAEEVALTTSLATQNLLEDGGWRGT